MRNFITSTVLLLILSAGIKAQSVTLKFNPDNGSKYDAATQTTTKMVQSVMGQNMEINMTYNINMDYSFSKAGEDNRLLMKYNKIDVNVDAMGQSKKLSSESDDADSKALKNFKDATLTAIINNKGEITEVKGADELASKVTDAQSKEVLKSLVSDEAMKKTLQQSFCNYPGKPLKVGDSWSDSMQVTQPYKMTIWNTYTLTKIENGISYMDVVTKSSSNGKQPFEAQGMQMEMIIDGTGKGRMVVDNATGIANTAETNQHMDATVYAMGQEIPMKIDVNAKTTVTKK